MKTVRITMESLFHEGFNVQRNPGPSVGTALVTKVAVGRKH